jgi:S1-C subfamily serine protease
VSDMQDHETPQDPYSYYWYPAPPPPADHADSPGPGGSPPRRRGRAAIAAIAAAFVLLASGVLIGVGLNDSHSPQRVALGGNSGNTGNSGNSSGTASIAQKVTPGVVDVNTFVSFGPYPFTRSNSTPLGAGTGMILTSTGEVLTNNHVIEGATSIEVTSPSLGKTWTASVVGADPTHDVALIQLQGASGLPTVNIASSSPDVGSSVVAIGNALGQGGSPSVTQGSITGTDRDINVGDGRGGFEHLQNLLQTDASISPGDSGGPLVNTSGQVIGIITASARGQLSGPSSNVGYAIPASDAINVVQQVRAGHGSSSIIIGPAGFLGVQVRDLTPADASRLGLGVTKGAFIVGVVQNTPAASAGITSGSVITAINGQSVDSGDALGPLLHVHRPGSAVQVTWVNSSGTHTATVHLVAGPAI